MATVTGSKLQNFIDGEFVDASELEDVINPSTGEVIARAPVSGAEDVDKAVMAARKAFEKWGLGNAACSFRGNAQARRRDSRTRR